MKKITTPHKADDEHYVFTEEINYFDAGKSSIWGTDHPLAVEAIRNIPKKGVWMDLASGDGRYTVSLLQRRVRVVATDIDKGALSKLYHRMPASQRSKLRIRAMDISKRFPFKDASFDGVFCSGILHLFLRSSIKAITEEIRRVLKPGGRILIIFPADIKRRYLNERPLIFGDETLYTRAEAERLLRDCFQGFDLDIRTSPRSKQTYLDTSPQYTFSSVTVRVLGKKPAR